MIYVGIDPGRNTGMAVYDSVSRQLLDVRCSGIVDAMRYLIELREKRWILGFPGISIQWEFLPMIPI